MLVSILVLFFRLRLIPSMPMPGEPRALGLDRAWSDVRFSAQTAPTQRKGREVKTKCCEDTKPVLCLIHQTRTDVRKSQDTYAEWSKVLSPNAICFCITHSGGFRDKPASLSHFSSNGLSLHMFLKLRFKASKREMVVWLKSFPYSFPMARPTSPWRGRQRIMNNASTSITINFTRSKESPTGYIPYVLYVLRIWAREYPHVYLQKKNAWNYKPGNHWILEDNKSIQSYTHLCEAQFDTSLFEGLGKLLQLLQITRLLQSGGIQPFGWCLTVGQGLNRCGCCCAGWSCRLQRTAKYTI